jgi:hypothetical protein
MLAVVVVVFVVVLANVLFSKHTIVLEHVFSIAHITLQICIVAVVI